MFEWKSEFSIHIGSIDAQHQNLFSMARDLYDAMSSGKGKSACTRILDRLVQYTAVHFAHEERLMRLNNYPGFEQHKAEHDALTRQVVKFRGDFQNGRVTLTVQLLQFLKDWLEKHIKGSDARYGAYLESLETVGAAPPTQTS